jgi:hypothetical protein
MDARDLSKAQHREERISSRLKFAKMLVRTEPCTRSRSYRRKVKRDGSRARRQLDHALLREQGG